MKNSLIDTVKFSIEIQHGDWIEEQKQQYAEGVINPITKTCFGISRKFRVPGSHESKATVWSKHNGSQLLVECSAPKFLTGHNVFGSESLQDIIINISKNICNYLGINPTAAEKKAVTDGLVRLYRIDLAAHISLPPPISVQRFIAALKMQLAFTQRSFSAYFEETLYVNQTSDMKTLKFYDKEKELLVHKLPASLPDRLYIQNYAKNLLRVEMTIRNRHLKKNKLSFLYNWDKTIVRQMMRNEICSLNLTDCSLLQNKSTQSIGNLPNCILTLHRLGVDLDTIIGNSRQLKTHADKIMQLTGVNIFVPQVAQKLSTIPVKSIFDKIRFGQNHRPT